ncbi:hypothetical protein KOR42_22690 [Thalassoglobus neptunius]|uniref:Uncharacterized protein n=1 Tax=Thalassoglobus neptunius TaxID=1938619 RepID=A0A5C5XAJ4_9PLAN|nr:hypothetical protein [Thalassoglobus neptunius]TWT58882.1 hypothetical protein KOR42_22690 [Thalassoglobus neptunius]
MLTLTVSQNGDGSADCSISGAGGGDTLTVYAVQVGTQWDSEQTWQSQGSRVGDGDVTVNTGKGAFWFFAESDVNEISKPIYAVVLDETDSVWDQVLAAVVAKLRLLSLEAETGSIASANVQSHYIVDPKTTPGLKVGELVVVTPANGENLTNEGPMQRDDYEYPVIVAHVMAANRSQTDALKAKWSRNRERIRNAFVNQPLATADATIWGCRMGQMPLLNDPWWTGNIMCSALQFQFLSRETRGV